MSVKRMLIIIKAICYTKPMKPKLLLGNSEIGCCRFNLWGSSGMVICSWLLQNEENTSIPITVYSEEHSIFEVKV